MDGDKLKNIIKKLFCLPPLPTVLISIPSLETAVLAQFGEDDETFRAVMTGATGGGVCTIAIGIIGILGIIAAYPLFSHITKRQRRKLAPKILELTDELMK